MAGVVQLHWAVEYAKEKLGLENHQVIDLEVLKFQVIIVPEQTLTLSLIRKSEEKVLFSYVSDNGKHASGRIVFGGDL